MTVDLAFYADDPAYVAGYLAGEEERIALAMENDRLRTELNRLVGGGLW